MRSVLRSSLLLALLVALSGMVVGQHVLRGTFVDSVTKAPLPFVNVVYDNAGHGVTSDLNGNFELTTSVPVERLIVSYVGYEPIIFTITEDLRKQWAQYPLRQLHVDIAAVYITHAENPALVLLRKALARRAIHSPSALPGYRFVSYSKMLATLLMPHGSTINTGNTPFPTESEKDGTRHFLFINETVSKHTHRRPNFTVDSVISTRTSGLKEKSLPVVASAMQSISFYDDELVLLEKRHVNPFSAGGLRLYDYAVRDTMVEHGGDSVIAVQFQPKKSRRDVTLSGVLYITAGEYALRNVIASTRADELDGDFRIAQNYKRVGENTWFPAELRSEVDLSGSSARITNETHIRDIVIDDAPKRRMATPLAPIIMADANKSIAGQYMTQYRATPLSNTELGTYRVTDSIAKAGRLESAIDFISDLREGYLWLEYVRVDLWRLLDYSHFEGFRPGVGLETTSRLAKRFRMSGYYAYGVADRKHKYGGRVGVKVWPQRDGWIDVRYSHDVATPGMPTFEEERWKGFRTLFVRKMDYRSGAHLTFQAYVTRKWHATLAVGYHRYENVSRYGLPTVLADGSYMAGTDDYTLLTPRLSLRYDPNPTLVQRADGLHSILPKRPELSLHVQQGFEPVHRRARYTKLDVQARHAWQSSLWGSCRASLAAGAVFGRYPLSQGYVNNGAADHRWGELTWGSLATMPPQHFYHDYQAALTAQYTVPIWMSIPISSAWRPAPSLMVNALWGGQWHTYRSAGQQPLPSADKGVLEIGLGLAGFLPLPLADFSSSLMLFYRVGPYASPYPKGNLGLALVYGFGMH